MYIQTIRCDFCGYQTDDDNLISHFNHFRKVEDTDSWFFRFAPTVRSHSHLCTACSDKLKAKIQQAFDEVAGKSVGGAVK